MDCITRLPFRITANRTEYLELLCVSDSPGPMTELANFPHKHLRALVRYLLDCCPNLKNIIIGYATLWTNTSRFRVFRFLVAEHFSAADFGPYADWILALNKQLISETLKDLKMRDCHLKIYNLAVFPMTTLQVNP